jgi:hypothetical protein
MPATAPGPKSVAFAATLVLAVLLACNGSGSRPAEEPDPAPKRVPPQQPIATQEYTPTPGTPAPAAPADSGDAPEISRSVGVEGGVIVLWPRLVLPHGAAKPDAETRALAGRAQARLADLARRALPGKTVEVRPEPERVCPKKGCKAISLGLLFAQAGGGCSLFALVSGSGPSPQRVVQWSPGLVRIANSTVPFRSPPESVVKVDDYGSCKKLPDDLSAHDADVEAAIKAVVGS